MNVTIKEDCKSVLLDNGIAPPMSMDIEAFIQMAVESRNDFSIRNACLETQLAQAKADNAAYRDGLIRIATTIQEYHPNGTLEQPKFSFAKELHDIAARLLESLEPGAELLQELALYKKALELAHAQLLYETAKHHFATPADIDSWLARAKEVLHGSI